VGPESIAAARSARLARLRAARLDQPAREIPSSDPLGPGPLVEGPDGVAAPGGGAATRDAGPLPAHGARERALGLAAQLRGELHEGLAGPVVVVTRPRALPFRGEPLRELPEPLDPDRPIVCLDTETTGLGTAAGTVPFLVGLGAWDGSRFVVRQLLLADHPDEVAFLEAVRAHLPEGVQLVTYNGRAFDWPLLVTRYRLHRLPPPSLAAHLDLLPLARRVWRHRLPDARLASVEAGVCAVRRHGDVPGADIPARFLAYLRSGRADGLHDVLRHNEQDIVSLASLLRVLTEELLPAGPGWLPRRSGDPPPPRDSIHPGDLGGLGAAFSRRGRHHAALACYEAALERLDPRWQTRSYERVAVERARTLARLGRRGEARSAWHAVALEGGRSAALAWIQVAKHLEHDVGDLPNALAAARRARSLAERSRLFGWPDRLVERDLARRQPRLERRLAAGRASAAVPPATVSASGGQRRGPSASDRGQDREGLLPARDPR
jgi:uncharacterized protein